MRYILIVVLMILLSACSQSKLAPVYPLTEHHYAPEGDTIEIWVIIDGERVYPPHGEGIGEDL